MAKQLEKIWPFGLATLSVLFVLLLSSALMGAFAGSFAAANPALASMTILIMAGVFLGAFFHSFLKFKSGILVMFVGFVTYSYIVQPILMSEVIPSVLSTRYLVNAVASFGFLSIAGTLGFAWRNRFRISGTMRLFLMAMGVITAVVFVLVNVGWV